MSSHLKGKVRRGLGMCSSLTPKTTTGINIGEAAVCLWMVKKESNGTLFKRQLFWKQTLLVRTAFNHFDLFSEWRCFWTPNLKFAAELPCLLGLVDQGGLHPGSGRQLSAKGFLLQAWPTRLMMVSQILMMETEHHHSAVGLGGNW